MMIKAVFFDMGGTIETFRYTREYRVSQAPVVRQCLEDGGIHLGMNDEQLADVITRGIHAYHQWNLNSMIELSTAEIWGDYVFKQFEIDREKIGRISENISFLYETRFYLREMRPEVPELLQKLKEMGLQIGCISNTQSLTQVPDSLINYGINGYFHPVVLSSAYGIRKPDPAIFYHATQQVNLPTGVCAYVGDKINRDVLGAKRAGFNLAVQIKHEYDDGETDEGADPDAVIHNLLELIPLIEGRNGSVQNVKPVQTNSKVKALFFDAGDILYYRPERNRHLAEFLNTKNVNPVADFENERVRLKDLAYSGQIDRQEYFEQIIHLHGIHDPEEVAKGVEAFLQDDDSVAIFEGVPETVNKLKEMGFVMGIITDTAMHYSKKLRWFEKHGFGSMWDVVISSKEIGIRKPAPIMYQKALDQAGIQPQEAVFIGHKAYELEGARALGMKTVAFNFEEEAVADAYVSNFCDILSVPFIKN